MPRLSIRGIFESLLPRFWFNQGILIIKKNHYKTHTSLTFFSLTHMGPTPHTFFLFHVALSHLTHKTHTINFYTKFFHLTTLILITAQHISHSQHYTLSLLSPRAYSLHHSLFLIHATLALFFLIHVTHPSHTLSRNPHHTPTNLH